MTAIAARRAMEVDEEEDDPIPNELDNALVHLIPAITACGSNPKLPSYLDLGTFEKLAGPALRGGDNAHAVAHPSGGGADTDKGNQSARRHLDARISGEIEVAFRHCMHEAGLALVGADTDIGGGGGASAPAAGGRGTRGRARKGKKGEAEAAALHTEADAMVKTMSGPLGILSLALEFVSREAELNESGVGINGALGGLPLLLLEDFLESQGRKACKVFWSSWVEPNEERLTKLLQMHTTGRYTLIRLCKKLAQRMSKTHDSSFCGQIHMFLASALGFFERSGLNVTGSINHDNVTAFEDEEQFRRTMMGFDVEEAAVTASGDGGDPMEVESAATGAGGKSDNKKQAGSASKEFAVDYPLYQSFWRLQKYTLQQDKAVKGEEAKKTWEALLADVDKILGAFEANAFSEHDLRLARERWAATGSPASSSAVAPSSSSSSLKGAAAQTGSTGKRKRGGGRGSAAAAADAEAKEVEAGGAGATVGSGGAGGPVYFGLKYLTSSRLLKLQLRDPTLRLQVLTQWLILAASLKSKIAGFKDCPNSVADLKPRIELAKRLVRATPPRGEEYLGMLQIILNRENAWTQWKDVTKCKDVVLVAEEEERRALKDKEDGGVESAPSHPNKRFRPPASRAQQERARHAPLGADFALEKKVEKLRAGVPSSEELLEEQKMFMEDPDTAASDWPSANPLFAWRALRLLGRENPANLVGCYDGDLVKTMKRMEKAKADAETAEAAAKAASAAAAAAAAVTTASAAVGSSAESPSKLEAAPAAEITGVEAAAVAAQQAAEGGDNARAMAVDGQEDGEVELKTEVAVAAAAGASDGGDSSAKDGSVDTNGVAAAAAAAKAAPKEARTDSEPAMVPDAAATKVEVETTNDAETPSSSGAADPASTPAPSDAAETPASAETGTPSTGNREDVGGGMGDGGEDSAAAAAPDTNATASPQEPPSGGSTATTSTEKSNDVAGWMAPVAGTRPAAAAKKAAASPPPSPARATRRKGKGAQKSGGK
eukprot:g13050.t1